MKRLTLFFLCLFASISWAAAQNRTIKGTVISGEDNLPVIGANVVVVGETTIGTVTDFDGNFTLSVPAKAKQLQVSYTGLKTQIVQIAPQMKIVLQSDTEVLKDLVVVGYGTARTIKSVAGSIARVSSDQLQEKPVANIMDALQGQVAGMNVATSSGDPNAVANVQIHGNGSLGASSSPLYIIDGVQTTPGVVASLNSNDIESISVLRDASATAIYGARAANGVIYITTKRGKSGEQARITASAQFGISQLISRGEYNNMMDGETLLAYQARHGFQKPYNWKKPWTVDDLWNQMKDVKKLTLGERGHDTDWLDYFMGKNAPTTQADLSLMGGSDKTTYFLSFGYFDQEGISRSTSEFTKYTGRLNLENRAKDWLKIGLNMTGAFTKAKTSRGFGGAYVDGGTFGALFQAPYITPYYPDGSPIVDENIITAFGPITSPYYSNKNYPRKDETDLFAASAYAQLTPVKGLTLKTLGGVDLNINHYRASALPSAALGDGLGQRLESFSKSRRFTTTNTAEYKWDINDNNRLTFLLGQEYVAYKGLGFQAVSEGQQDDRFLMLQQGQMGNFLSLPSSSESEYAYNSYFGRINYDFDRFLFLDATVRNDASSRFGDNHRSGWFYSFGAMADLHEKLMPDNEKVSSLQVKASYGTTGNSEIGNYSSMALVGSSHYTDGLALSVISAGNPDLSWETQKKLNLGAAAGFFNDRLNVDLDFYLRKTTDMLMDVPMPYSTGFGYRYENVGAMENMGVDLTLDASIVRTKDWAFNAKATFNYNKEKVTELFYGLDEYEIPGTSVRYVVGDATQLSMPDFARINPENGAPQWYVPNTPAANEYYQGDRVKEYKGRRVTEDFNDVLLTGATGKKRFAPFNGGFSFNLSWLKVGLTLQADFAYSLGKYMINNDRFFTENNSEDFLMSNHSTRVLDEWTPENKNGKIGKFGNTGNMQFDTRLLENSSFLRMKNLQLTYQLPSSIFSEKTVVSGAKVYVLARNLFTVTKFKGFDPEPISNLSMNQFPNTRQFMAGVQLQF